jgi:DNA-binding transcriptional MerR regulator
VSEAVQVEAAPRRPQKSDAAFRTISEVSEDLDVPQHVLRFWESRFPTIKPLKRGGGRRYYRPEDVQLLRRIRDLLYKDGYTIRGVQKLLREPSRGEIGTSDGGEPEADAPIVLPAREPIASAPRAAAPEPAPAIPVARTLPIAAAPAPVSHVERPGPAPQTATAISGARRALLETLLAEIDELRATLAAALKRDDG